MRMHHFLLIGVASLTSVWEIAMSAETQPGQPINIGQIEQLNSPERIVQQRGRRFQGHGASQRRAVLGGRLEDASVYGADFMGGLHPRQESRSHGDGNLVIMQDEVNPVMSAALDASLSVTAPQPFLL